MFPRGKSMIAVMRPFGEVVVSPLKYVTPPMNWASWQDCSKAWTARPVWWWNPRVITMLRWPGCSTTRAFFVSVVNAMLVHDYGNNSLRRAKTDKKDAVKLANYGLDHWLTLPRYIPEEDTRLMLKICYRQYQQYSKVQTMLKNNLISLLDTTFPDANRLFTSPPRADGSEKWVDFVAAFWHCECVCNLSEKAFTAKYHKWCRKHRYKFCEDKTLDIYSSACGHFGVIPKTDTAKLFGGTGSFPNPGNFNHISCSQAGDAVSGSFSSGVSCGYGDVWYWTCPRPPTHGWNWRCTSVSFQKSVGCLCGYCAPPYQSGQIDVRSRSISKRGSASLRRTLFLVMSVILQCAPIDEPVYQFMDKKRSEGKPYRVYMMASANKFLRIYYASVKAYLDSAEHNWFFLCFCQLD